MRNDCLDLGSINDNIWREVDGFEVFRDGTLIVSWVWERESGLLSWATDDLCEFGKVTVEEE